MPFFGHPERGWGQSRQFETLLCHRTSGREGCSRPVASPEQSWRQLYLHLVGFFQVKRHFVRVLSYSIVGVAFIEGHPHLAKGSGIYKV